MLISFLIDVAFVIGEIEFRTYQRVVTIRHIFGTYKIILAVTVTGERALKMETRYTYEEIEGLSRIRYYNHRF